MSDPTDAAADDPPDLLDSLVGATLHELRLGGSGQLRLQFAHADRDDLNLYADISDATLTTTDGVEHAIDGDELSTLMPLVRVVQRAVAVAHARGGTLTIGFDDGSSLRCPPDERYEAWEVVGGSPYSLVVCTPGGELAYWDDRIPPIRLDPRPPLEQVVWSDEDFERMSWHDVTIHAMAFVDEESAAELVVDLDYLVEWFEPTPPSVSYGFSIAPATLVFESVSELTGTLEPSAATRLEINAVERSELEPDGRRRLLILGHTFEISFAAAGFRQHFRDRPTRTGGQRLTLEQRGGSSFARPTELP